MAQFVHLHIDLKGLATAQQKQALEQTLAERHWERMLEAPGDWRKERDERQCDDVLFETIRMELKECARFAKLGFVQATASWNGRSQYVGFSPARDGQHL